MNKAFIFLTSLGLVVFTFLFLVTTKPEATQGHHHGPYPTVRPTVTPTPTVEIDPCDVEEKFTEAYLYDFEPCPTEAPAPTLAPSDHGDGLSDGRSDGRAGQRPGDPSCTVPFSEPYGVTFKRLSPTSVQLFWTPSVDRPQHQSIVYGRENGQELWGVNGLSGDTKEFTLNALPENEHIWVQIVNQKDSCSSRSAWIDP